MSDRGGRRAHQTSTVVCLATTFTVSFLTIGIIWVNHHAQFELVGSVDRPLLFFNLLLLMVVVLIPFTTGLLAEHLHAGADQHIAAAVYSGTLLVMGLAFFALWARVARRRHRLAVYYVFPTRRRETG